jgi:hypothetical protein
MKSDETMIPHPEAVDQNLFQIAEFICWFERNKITLPSRKTQLPHTAD